MASDIATDYRLRRPLYEKFAARLADLLRTLLTEAGIRIHTVEHRAKEVDSFIQKVQRPEKSYKNPLKDVTDLAGVRIIAYNIDDIRRITQLIRQEFVVDERHSSDRTTALKPNEFGYQSHHLVVALNKARAGLLEWKPLGDLAAEIQVRTVLQHAWAAISHVVQYKTQTDLPDILSRRMFRVSGLLELADEEFAAISREAAAIVSQLAASVTGGNLKHAVDRTSLEHYVDSQTACTIARTGEEAGFNFNEDPDPDESIRELVWACEHVGVSTVAELDDLCQANLEVASSFFKYLRARSKTSWGASTPWLIELLLIVLFKTRFSVDTLVQREWSAEIAERVIRAVNAWKPPPYHALHQTAAGAILSRR